MGFEYLAIQDRMSHSNTFSPSIYSFHIFSEIEYIMQKEYDNFHEYSYSLVKSLDDPNKLLLGLDFEYFLHE